MISALEKEITLRYLKTRKKDGFLNIISIFSFIGISLGVAVLIIVMSVMNGFRTELINKIVGFNAHVTVKPYESPKPKLAMEECKIGNKNIKIYGIAKGSGMIHPNMATTLAYIFTDAKLSNDILNKLLKKNISTTFNAITCDGDTSTNDMATIFATGKVENSQIKNINDKKIQNFDKALNKVLLNLAKRVVSDGEGSSKFVTVNVKKCKSEIDAKQIAFSIANSPLVKTAIAGEDPNWGRIIMAIGKAGPKINLKKLSIKFGNLKIVQDGKLHQSYDEKKLQYI